MTGPSFTSSTSMRAPKTPVSTGTSAPAVRRRSARRAALRPPARRPREARAISLRRVREQRELADDERCATRVEQRAVETSRPVLEHPQACHLPGEPVGLRPRVVLPNAEQHERPALDLAAHDRAARPKRGRPAAGRLSAVQVIDPRRRSARARCERDASLKWPFASASGPASRASGRARSARSRRPARAREARNSASASAQRWIRKYAIPSASRMDALVRLEPLRLLERDGRLGGHARPSDAPCPAGRGRTRRS